jgi:hypothetical protein
LSPWSTTYAPELSAALADSADYPEFNLKSGNRRQFCLVDRYPHPML